MNEIITNDSTSKTIRGWVNMFVATCGIVAVWNPLYYNYFSVIMAAYMIYGLFIDSLDYCIHHILSISFILFKLMYVRDDDVTNHAMIYLTRCEYSSVFYLGQILVSDFIKRANSKALNRLAPALKIIFNLAFVVTFVKVRIIELGYYLIANPYSYQWHPEYFGNNLIPYIHYNASIWGFYALNLYWFAIILKKIYKTLFLKYDSHLLCEFLSRYTVIISVLAVLYAYHKNGQLFTIPAIIDIHGLVFLSYTSYKFHSFLYNELQVTGESFNSLSKGSHLIIEDAMAIGFQSFNTFVASSYIYYKTQPIFVMKCILFMGFVSLLSNYFTHKHIEYMNENDIQLIFNQPNPNRTKLYIIVNAPCVLGVLANIYLCKSFMIYEDLMSWIPIQLCCIYFSILISATEPFKNMNHAAIHIIFALYHYFMANQISK